MAFLKYSDIQVFANFTTDGGINDLLSAKHLFAATDISLNLDASTAVKRFLGGSRPEMNPQGPMEGKVSMSFFPMIETTSSLNLNVQKENQLAFFGTTGDFTYGHSINISNFALKQVFLQNYSIKINPYQPVVISANFTAYDVTKLEDQTLQKGTSFQLTKNVNKPTYEALHGLTTVISSAATSDYLPETKTSVEINVECQRIPIYAIGNKFPSSVKLTSVERTISIQGEAVGKIMNLQGKDMPDLAIHFLPLSRLGQTPNLQNNVLSFNINGKILSQQLSVSQNSTLNGKIAIKEIIL